VNFVATATFDRRDDREAARISVASISAAVEQIATAGDVDAVFVSCTSLRVAQSIAALEERLGISVTSSNHAMAWHCLRLAGVKEAMPHAGRLFER